MSHPQPAPAFSAVESNDEWQPHAAEEFQEIGLVGRIAIGLLGASTLTHLLSTWSDWNTYGVVHQYLGGGLHVDDADLNRADAIAKFTAIPNVIVSVAAAVVFVIWLWRARVNSEVLCQADHRHGHGWVLASWFCPGPNLWYPKQIVDDVWLASDPRTPVYADDLRRLGKPLLTKVWWCTWVGALAFDVVIRRFLMWMQASVGSLRGIALAGTASLVLTALAAVAATLVIRKITTMQTSREWVPWWDQHERPKLTAVPTYADDDTSEQEAIAEPIAVAPALRLERQPEPQLQLAGGGAEEAPPTWSPFAPVVETWQDAGPATQQFSPFESWRDDPAQETSHQQSASAPESLTWSTPANPYTKPSTDDLLSAPRDSWQAETVAPASLSLVQPEPYTPSSYEPAEPSWASSYSEPYSSSYQSSSSDYLTSTEQVEPAPEPEPEPVVARAGRRAARVAVDSPSTVQSAVPSSSYYEQAPALPEQDDFLTPSKPLPPVPSYGPEPTYNPEPTYTAYDAPAVSPPSGTSYTSDYSDSSYQYSTEPTYDPETSYSPYESYRSSEQPTYDTYSSSYDSTSYSQSSYDNTNYGTTESYETSSYTPNYTPESYSSSDSSNTDYSSNYSSEQPSTEYQSPYSYEQQPAEAAETPKEDSETTAPRTHPRRRWV
ncbi:MAG TPA: DUF4328 domain-containing protein [Kribbella sp.]